MESHIHNTEGDESGELISGYNVNELSKKGSIHEG